MHLSKLVVLCGLFSFANAVFCNSGEYSCGFLWLSCCSCSSWSGTAYCSTCSADASCCTSCTNGYSGCNCDTPPVQPPTLTIEISTTNTPINPLNWSNYCNLAVSQNGCVCSNFSLPNSGCQAAYVESEVMLQSNVQATIAEGNIVSFSSFQVAPTLTFEYALTVQWWLYNNHPATLLVSAYGSENSSCPGFSSLYDGSTPMCCLDCNLWINHAVTLVGWAFMDNSFVWIVQNSWGESWGDDGLFYLRFEDVGSNSGQFTASNITGLVITGVNFAWLPTADELSSWVPPSIFNWAGVGQFANIRNGNAPRNTSTTITSTATTTIMSTTTTTTTNTATTTTTTTTMTSTTNLTTNASTVGFFPQCSTKIMNQATCGSCYAFASTTVIGTALCVVYNGTGSFTYLSPQMTLDLNFKQRSADPCDGGLPSLTINYVGSLFQSSKSLSTCHGSFTAGNNACNSGCLPYTESSCPEGVDDGDSLSGAAATKISESLVGAPKPLSTTSTDAKHVLFEFLRFWLEDIVQDKENHAFHSLESASIQVVNGFLYQLHVHMRHRIDGLYSTKATLHRGKQWSLARFRTNLPADRLASNKLQRLRHG